MPGNFLSRRDVLRSLGGAVAASAWSVAPAPSLAQAPGKSPGLVDVHVHIASSRLSRLRGNDELPEPFNLVQQSGGAERLARQIEQEFQAAGVTHALCMPTAVISDDDPLGIMPTLKQASLIRGAKLHPVGVLHPERFDREHLERVEAVLKQGEVKALKAYLGYLHYGPLFVGYRPYYRLAAKYNVPIIFHTGDTYSPVAKVKYAHPLAMDEIAVDFPDTKFVLAHFGNPWTMDAAQVVYKNKNVWTDLSAFLIGDNAAFSTMEKEGVLERTAKRVREAVEYTEAPERFLFGSDWPLAPIKVYRDFVARLLPTELHAGLFHDNAKKLFGL